jgi:hypothetical protein
MDRSDRQVWQSENSEEPKLIKYKTLLQSALIGSVLISLTVLTALADSKSAPIFIAQNERPTRYGEGIDDGAKSQSGLRSAQFQYGGNRWARPGNNQPNYQDDAQPNYNSPAWHDNLGQLLVNYRFPPRSYDETNIKSWKVFLERPMIERNPNLANQVCARLAHKLDELMVLFPPTAYQDFNGLTFFVMLGGKGPDGKPINGLEFCLPNAPDVHPNVDFRWRRCIVVHSAPNYVRLTEFWALKALVHEMSHAHHLLNWPENQPDIVRAWKNAMTRDLYRNVRDADGHVLPKAYAVTNAKEYFAELSAMYFCGCNYYPFNRDQLRQYDPMGYAMVCKLWGVN